MGSNHVSCSKISHKLFIAVDSNASGIGGAVIVPTQESLCGIGRYGYGRDGITSIVQTATIGCAVLRVVRNNGQCILGSKIVKSHKIRIICIGRHHKATRIGGYAVAPKSENITRQLVCL